MSAPRRMLGRSRNCHRARSAQFVCRCCRFMQRYKDTPIAVARPSAVVANCSIEKRTKNGSGVDRLRCRQRVLSAESRCRIPTKRHWCFCARESSSRIQRLCVTWHWFMVLGSLGFQWIGLKVLPSFASLPILAGLLLSINSATSSFMARWVFNGTRKRRSGIGRKPPKAVTCPR